jgi:YVTN family beta-propeller protein
MSKFLNKFIYINNVMKSKLFGIALTLLLFQNNIIHAQTSSFQLAKTFHIKSDGWWDYLVADPESNKLYVSHGTQVNVLDKNNGDSLGVILNTTGVHGIALVHSLNKGYTSNGRLNNVTVFNLETLQPIKQIVTGKNPDAILYDDYSKKIITCNGTSKDLSVIDPATDKVIATIPLTGKPETAVSDGAGKIFVNNEDKSEIAVVDIKNDKVLYNWSIAPGEAPTGLCIDRNTKRLFAGCDNKLLIVVDATNGKVISKIPIGDGCDGTAFDASLNYIFASCGEGVLTVIQETSSNDFKVVENIKTKRGARTLSADANTHSIYLPTAEFQPSANQNQRPQPVSGSFQVLVFERK